MFSRFQEYLQVAIDRTLPKYKGLVQELKEIASLRNQVVHADWENTDEEGYTYVRLHFSKGDMLQEYVQFSAESLVKLLDRILKASVWLSEYWDERCNILYGLNSNT